MRRTISLLTCFCIAIINGSALAQSVTTLNAPVGIGTSTPNSDLHIHNTEIHEYGSGFEPDGLRTGNDNGYYITSFHMTNPHSGGTYTDGFMIKQTSGLVTLQQNESKFLNIFACNGRGIVVDSTGRIGICGAPVPGYALKVDSNIYAKQNIMVGNDVTAIHDITANHAVNTMNANVNGTLTVNGNSYLGSGFVCTYDGHVRTREVRVTQTGWSDFVFSEDYKLMPLSQLEKYIKNYRHLPEIPTESEVKRDGVSISEMNIMMLQKIEELTLYIIDLQKQINELKGQQK